MKIKNKRILALLGRASFVVVVCAMNCYADATTDKQAYLDGTRRELVGGFQLPPDIVGVQREATLVSGTGTLAVFDVVTTITDATNTAGVVSGPYEAPFVNNSIDEVPYLDGISDERNIVINMEGGSVGQLWGAYYYSDVPNGKITHNVSGGLVDYLVGGVNLTDSTNVRPGFTPGQVQGVEINISGGNVGQIRGGNSTSEGELAAAQHIGSGGVSINISGGVIGKEGQQDAIRGAGGSYDGVEGKVSVNISGDAEIVGDVYAGARQAKVDSTEVHISGGTIQAIKRNSKGEIVKEEITVEPVAGKDVWLTIDIDTQMAAEDALKQYMKDFNKNEGASVALDPNTGDILAIASYPTYDLTTFSKEYNSLASNEYLPLLNRACYAVYAPGSTFKVAVSLAGLEEGAISSSSKITCNHGYKLHGINVDCSNHNDYYSSSLNVIEALTFSCNAFFMETGYDRLDINTMTNYCISLGLGQSTGIEIPELTGQIACPENALGWNAYEEASSYIGQSIHQYSPLQVTSYIATVANGGTRYATHLLQSVREFSGAIVKEYGKEVLSTVNISPHTLSTIKTGMRNMIDNSPTSTWNMYTKYNIAATVCGKSGTAQIGGGRQNCWFTAFAPMNTPRIVVTSIIENGSSGASVSAIDAAIIAAYLNK